MKKCFAGLLVAVALGCTMTYDSGTLYTGGLVVPGANQTPRPNYAVYVNGDRIAAVGSADELRRAHPKAKVVDLTGTTVLPGLTDAHAHLYGLGLSLDTVSLVGAASIDEIVTKVRERASRAQSGDWVLGRGWDQNRWADKQFPTSVALDAITDQPVWLKRVDGHAGWANAAAIRAAGVTAATPDPSGGRILRDANGNPTGVFIDEAQELVERAIPAPSFELRKSRVRAAAQRIADNGLTEIHDAGADAQTIRAVRELIEAGDFPIRVYTMLGDDAELIKEWFARGKFVSDRLTVRAVKLYADGALGSRGAALLAPYSDDPSNSGLVIASVDHMLDVARRARAAGFQVNTHAIGDRGVRNVIESYERANVTATDRFRIEHYQVVAPEDFARTIRAGIIASMQPTHATSDSPWAEARVGPERIRGAYAWRTVLNAGGRLALGSDFPVEDVNPFLGIEAAVTRNGWYPDQALTLAEAIRGFTKDAAYAAFEEDSRGTIEVGKLADFTVVEGDLYVMPRGELGKAKVRHTIVGGKIVPRQ
jgi:predicted amidohydrolase YtcJ